MNESLIESTICYVCGADLVQLYKTENDQTCLPSMLQKYPQMTLWNGSKKNVCDSCYNAAQECLTAYYETVGPKIPTKS